MNIKRAFLSPLLFLFSPKLWAISTLFSLETTDKSVEYLGLIFGPMGDLPLSGGNSLFAQMLSVFSTTILTLSIVVVVFNIVLSVAMTAAHGEVMGKNWSSFWVPIRTLGGLILLLPTESGYCKIQIFFMWLLLNSIGAANSMWNVVLDAYAAGVSLSQPSSSSSDVSLLSKNVFRSMLCMDYLNNQMLNGNTPPDYTPVGVYYSGNDIIFGFDESRPICGKISLRDFSSMLDQFRLPDSQDPSEITALQRQGINQMRLDLQAGVDEAIANNQDDWSPKVRNVFAKANTTFNEVIANASTHLKSISSVVDDARADGWIFAGAYYHTLVNATMSPNLAKLLPDYTTLDIVKYGEFANNASLQGSVNTQATSYIKAITEPPSDVRKSVGLQPSNLGGSAKAGWDATFGQVKNLATSFTDYLTTNHPDPIYSMATVGSNIMITVEIIWIGILLLVIAVTPLAFISESLQGAGHFFMDTLNLILPAFSAVMIMLWGAGVTLALYIPFIPYLVYTFAALSWIFEVVEGVIAAPLVAFILIIPSEDEWGHGSQSFLMYLGIFLRPVLMLMGFVAGSKMLMVGISFMNFGFAGTVNSQLMGVGLFSSFVLIAIYVAGVTALTHESFSLIYKLPNKIMHWIGHTAGGSEREATLLGQAKDASQTGGESSGEIAKFSIGASSSIAGKISNQAGGGGSGVK